MMFQAIIVHSSKPKFLGFCLFLIVLACQKGTDSPPSDESLIPNITSEEINELCSKGCIKGYLAHGIGLEMGESEIAHFKPLTRGFSSTEFKDVQHWHDRFDDVFLEPYFKETGLDIKEFAISFKPKQYRDNFMDGFSAKINAKEVSMKLDKSGNFLLNSFEKVPQSGDLISLEKVFTIEFTNQKNGLIRYQCLVIQTELEIESDLTPAQIMDIGKVSSYSFYYTAAWRPCLKTIDIETVAIIDPLLSGFTSQPAGEEYSDQDLGPDVYFLSMPSRYTQKSSGQLRFRSTLRGVKFKCKFLFLDDDHQKDSRFQDCKDQYSFKNKADGNYGLLVRSYNELGTGLSIASAIVTIDTQAPIVSDDNFKCDEPRSAVSGTIGLWDLTCELTETEDIVGFDFKINGGTWQSYEGILSIQDFPVGQHLISFRAKDLAGNYSDVQNVIIDI